jgi:glycosyltransferase involved in cell wall biosynthesis
MRKYLFIAAHEYLKWGGSEELWSSAAEKLARCGNEVRVSVPEVRKGIPQMERLGSAGCRIFYRRAFPAFLYRLGSRVFPLPEHKRRHMRLAASGVDLVVISQAGNNDGLPWLEEAKAVGCRYAVIAQGAIPYWWPDDGVSEKLGERYEEACAAYFVSQALLDTTRRQFASPLRNAKVVRNPFNVSYEACTPWPIDDTEMLRLACVARVEVGKGHDLIMQVLALPPWRSRKVWVSLVGTGPNERILRRVAEQLNLTSVGFCGESNDIEGVWAKHHALLLPSRFEGMPLSVVEAMLCGRPCVATDVGGIRELLRDGSNGFLAKAPTVELLDEAMSRAWECRSRLQEMGNQAAADVRQFISRDPGEDFARELEGLLEVREPK